MNYMVRLTYIDDKTLDISLPDGEVPKFLEKMKKNEAYWTADSENAFWTPENQIRFVNIVKEQLPPVEPVVEDVKEPTIENTDKECPHEGSPC